MVVSSGQGTVIVPNPDSFTVVIDMDTEEGITVLRGNVLTVFEYNNGWEQPFTDAIAYLEDGDVMTFPTGIEINGQDYDIPTDNFTLHANQSWIRAKTDSVDWPTTGAVISFTGGGNMTINDLNVECIHASTGVGKSGIKAGSYDCTLRMNRCHVQEMPGGSSSYLYQISAKDYELNDCSGTNPGFSCFRDRVTGGSAEPGVSVGVLNRFTATINVDNEGVNGGKNRFMSVGRWYGGSITLNDCVWNSSLTIGSSRVTANAGSGTNSYEYVDNLIVNGVTVNVGDVASWWKIYSVNNIELRNVTWNRGDFRSDPDGSAFGYTLHIGAETAVMPTILLDNVTTTGYLNVYNTVGTLTINNSDFGANTTLNNGYLISGAQMITNLVLTGTVTCSQMTNRGIWGEIITGTYESLTFNCINSANIFMFSGGATVQHDFKGPGIVVNENGTANGYLANNSITRLSLSKDAAGDYHYDETLLGTGVNGYGQPPPPFTGFAGVENEQIINDNYGSGSYPTITYWNYETDTWAGKTTAPVDP